jgi:PAS domain S-box-containing protein
MNENQNTIFPEIRLPELIDIGNVITMMESFYELTGIPLALIDINGNILAGAGWQEICTKFHRKNPRTEKNCIDSDMKLTSEISKGEFRLYKCKNGMWDMATPLFVGNHRIGHLFSGQFFFTDEKIDKDFFIQQATRYKFDCDEYLIALENVPRLERSYIEKAEAFFIKLAATLAELGYYRLKLEKALEDTYVLLANTKHNAFLLEQAQSIANLGSWQFDLLTNRLVWSDEVYRIFGVQHLDFVPTYEGFLSSIHPDDKEAVEKAYSGSIIESQDTYQIEHRVIRKNTSEIRWVLEKCKHLRDNTGKIVRAVGIVQDITEIKNTD